MFLTAYRAKKNFPCINIADFFCGPGYDAAGNPGTPLIIQDELKHFCSEHETIRAHGIEVNLLFNDIDGEKVKELRQATTENACEQECCRTSSSNVPFEKALEQTLPQLRAPDSANLVIMDQFGVKEVTPPVVDKLLSCGTTDILFFISSSFIRRFAAEPAMQQHFNVSSDELLSVPHRSIHRYVCGYFRERTSCQDAFFAPFSIRRGSNIYGIVFASRRLLGLDKFLTACWQLDGVTGEANYAIDGDPSWHGQLSLFEDDNVILKRDGFRRALEDRLHEPHAEAITAGHGQISPSNRDIYRFTLERGFRPQHAKEYLADLRKQGRLDIIDPRTGERTNGRAFYLTWKAYSTGEAKVLYRLKE